MKAPEKFRIALAGTTIDIIRRGNAGAKVDHYIGQLLSGRELPDDFLRPWHLQVDIAEAPELLGPVSIFTVARENGYIEVTCQHCNRTAVYAAQPFSELARGARVQSDLRDLGRQMRCDPKGGGCGKRGATVRPIDWKPAA